MSWVEFGYTVELSGNVEFMYETIIATFALPYSGSPLARSVLLRLQFLAQLTEERGGGVQVELFVAISQ